MKPLDARALHRHLEAVGARLQGEWAALVPEAMALRRSATMEACRALLEKVERLIAGGERDVVAFLKPYIRSCHTPAERIAMADLADRIGREFRHAIKTQIIDVDMLREGFANAEKAEDEFADMISDILGEDEQ